MSENVRFCPVSQKSTGKAGASIYGQTTYTRSHSRVRPDTPDILLWSLRSTPYVLRSCSPLSQNVPQCPIPGHPPILASACVAMPCDYLTYGNVPLEKTAKVAGTSGANGSRVGRPISRNVQRPTRRRSPAAKLRRSPQASARPSTRPCARTSPPRRRSSSSPAHAPSSRRRDSCGSCCGIAKRRSSTLPWDR
jgi:hypothetical protein